MTLKFESGALVIRDGAGNVKFSTDEKLFTVTDFVDSRVVGPVSYDAVVARGTINAAPYTNTTTDKRITNVNAAADIVFGMLQIVASSSSTDNSQNSGLWSQVNGTNVYSIWAMGEQAGGVARTDCRFLSTLGLFTFYITGGQLFLRNRLVHRAWAPLTDINVTNTVPAFTVNFRLYCGTFI